MKNQQHNPTTVSGLSDVLQALTQRSEKQVSGPKFSTDLEGSGRKRDNA